MVCYQFDTILKNTPRKANVMWIIVEIVIIHMVLADHQFGMEKPERKDLYKPLN